MKQGNCNLTFIKPYFQNELIVGGPDLISEITVKYRKGCCTCTQEGQQRVQRTIGGVVTGGQSAADEFEMIAIGMDMTDRVLDQWPETGNGQVLK